MTPQHHYICPWFPSWRLATLIPFYWSRQRSCPSLQRQMHKPFRSRLSEWESCETRIDDRKPVVANTTTKNIPVAPVTTAHFPSFFKSLPGRRNVLYKCDNAFRVKLSPNSPTIPIQVVSSDTLSMVTRDVWVCGITKSVDSGCDERKRAILVPSATDVRQIKHVPRQTSNSINNYKELLIIRCL